MTDAALHLLAWYAALALIGAGGLLPAALICDRLHTRGVLYARPLGLAIVALTAWLLAWAGWMPYGTPLVIAAVLALAAWNVRIARRHPEAWRAVLARRTTILVGEALWVVVFALVVLARAQVPEATGTEKPMDLMVLTAVHRATTFPPPDPWLAGFSLSYYHLGHLGADVLARLSGTSTGVAFNLATATAGAGAAAALAGLVVDVIALGRVDRPRAIPAGREEVRGQAKDRPVGRGALATGASIGLVTLLLVTPLVGIVNLAGANGIGDAGWWAMLGVPGVPPEPGAAHGVPTAFWWWWSSTRILPGTITEFPAFTLLLGDPHAHLLALPIDLVAAALAVATFEGGAPLTWRRWVQHPDRLLITAAVFAALFMTNSWDVLVYGGLWGAAGTAAFRRAGWSWMPALVGAVRWAMLPAGLAMLLAFGFLRSIDAPSLGIAPVIGERSDLPRWLLVWLPPLLPVAAALALLRPAARRGTAARALAVVLVAVACWGAIVIAEGVPGEFLARGSGWIVLGGLALAIAGLVAAAADADGRSDRALAAALAVLAAALGVLFATELFRIADAFPGRLNTIFKLWFNAWALIAVAAGALFGLAWDRGRAAHAAAHLGVGGALLVALATAAFVPAMAVSRAREGQARGLDAEAYFAQTDPGLAAAVEWSREHLDPRHAVVVQAIGESYETVNVLSVETGVPTLLSWANHERQWRRNVPEGERRAAVDAIYEQGAVPASAEIARRFGATYVYVGRAERARYGPGVPARFAAWPSVVDTDGALLVKIP
ncbi:MAG: DUF2298 domain-containing protein [Dehalococcoidia bacterium]